MTRTALATALTLVICVAAGLRAGAQAGLSANAKAVDAYVGGRVAAGEMDQGAAEEAIARAYSNGSLSKADYDKLTEKVRKEFDQLKKDRKEQNPVFKAEWPWGSVFPGKTYKSTLVVTNGCKAGQTVSISYPKNMFMSGPASVDVPGRGKVDVPITVAVPPLQIPPFQPVPVMLPPCPILEGEVVAEHPQAGRCLAMRRVYSVAMQLHFDPEPGGGNNGGGGGGGGGGGKKKKSPVCETLWTRGEFVPTREKPSPDSCTTEMREYAEEMMPQVEEEKKKSGPGDWAWMPPNAKLAGMTAAEILAWRKRVSQQTCQRVVCK
jgi:hypothetical protein